MRMNIHRVVQKQHLAIQFSLHHLVCNESFNGTLIGKPFSRVIIILIVHRSHPSIVSKLCSFRVKLNASLLSIFAFFFFLFDASSFFFLFLFYVSLSFFFFFFSRFHARKKLIFDNQAGATIGAVREKITRFLFFFFFFLERVN